MYFCENKKYYCIYYLLYDAMIIDMFKTLRQCFSFFFRPMRANEIKVTE